MKRLFLVLLLVNILFAVVAQLAVKGSSETAIDHQPLNAEKIQIVDGVAQPAQSENVPSAPSLPDKARVCLEWGIFSGDDLKQAQTALKTLNLDETKLTQLKVEETNRYWVYIPPLASKAAAEKKIAELKTMGVNDFLLMPAEGKWQFAISLGVFATEDAAAKYLVQLQKKGVRSAKSGPRQHETGEVRFQIRDVSDEMATKLIEMKEGFQGSELKAVACK